MQITNALLWNPTAQKLTGSLICTPDEVGVGLVDFGLFLPGLKPATLYAGWDKYVCTNPDKPIWLAPGGPVDTPGGTYTSALVVPMVADLTGDGTVDEADLGAALAQWQAGDGSMIGLISSAWGSAEQVVASKKTQILDGVSIMSPGGSPPFNAVVPILSPVLGKFRLRFTASPGTKVVYSVNATLVS